MRPRGCLVADELVDAIHEELADDATQHLLACRTCTSRISLLRRANSAGIEPVAATILEADTLVARLIIAPRDEWWPILRAPEYQSSDVVRRLIALADDASLRDRKEAVALVSAATRIADSLPRNQPGIADLRFQTWKFASAILREAGNYKYTELALAQASDAAREASDPELAEALVLLARALLFAEPDIWRSDEASELLDRAEKLFAERKDTVRELAVRTTRAFLQFRAGDFGPARVAFAEILAATPPTPRENYLNALGNLVAARTEFGEADEEVRQSVELLINEYESRGRKVHAARARWYMGDVRRLRGEYDEAADFYRHAMREIGDSDSAIRAGLRLLETLVLAERHDEALMLARHLAGEAIALDRREPSRRRSLTAAVSAYARDAAERGALTADLASELTRYVDRIYRQRPVDFIPPMPLAAM